MWHRRDGWPVHSDVAVPRKQHACERALQHAAAVRSSGWQTGCAARLCVGAARGGRKVVVWKGCTEVVGPGPVGSMQRRDVTSWLHCLGRRTPAYRWSCSRPGRQGNPPYLPQGAWESGSVPCSGGQDDSAAAQAPHSVAARAQTWFISARSAAGADYDVTVMRTAWQRRGGSGGTGPASSARYSSLEGSMGRGPLEGRWPGGAAAEV